MVVDNYRMFTFVHSYFVFYSVDYTIINEWIRSLKVAKRNNMKNIYFYLIAVLITASSCSSKRNLSYFQDLGGDNIEVKGASYSDAITYRENDELSIVISASDPQAASQFNVIVPSRRSTAESVSLSATETLQSYVVDGEGNINFPVLGRIKVGGLTRTELIKKLEEELSKSIKNPIVNVRLINLKIGVLGEVNAPGSFVFENQRVSVLDALTFAGDLTVYGNRENVLIYRDNENGLKRIIRLDLTKSDLLFSPDFYLQQNDVVYVEPNNAKQKESNVGARDQYNLSIIGTIVSVASIMIALFR